MTRRYGSVLVLPPAKAAGANRPIVVATDAEELVSALGKLRIVGVVVATAQSRSWLEQRSPTLLTDRPVLTIDEATDRTQDHTAFWRDVVVYDALGAGQLAASISKRARAWRLSALETDVLVRILRGETRAEIEAMLGISPNTVKGAVRALLHESGTVDTKQLRAVVSAYALSARAAVPHGS